MLRTVTSLIVLSAFAFISETPALAQAKTETLLTKELEKLENREVLMFTVEYPPGQVSSAHRHNAHTFVYVVEGSVIMGVEGKEPVRLEAGQTFYESPSDIHTVGRNASDTRPAKLLVTMIKEKGAPTTVPVKQEQF